MKYDDHETSCPMCSLGLDEDALCWCEDPFCWRCHQVHHVNRGRWAA